MRPCALWHSFAVYPRLRGRSAELGVPLGPSSVHQKLLDGADLSARRRAEGCGFADAAVKSIPSRRAPRRWRCLSFTAPASGRGVHAMPISSADSAVESVLVPLQDLPLPEDLGMGPELPVPLTSIQGLDGRAGRCAARPGRDAAAFRIIDERADHMRGLIHYLLDPGPIEAGRLTDEPLAHPRRRPLARLRLRPTRHVGLGAW